MFNTLKEVLVVLAYLILGVGFLAYSIFIIYTGYLGFALVMPVWAAIGIVVLLLALDASFIVSIAAIWGIHSWLGYSYFVSTLIALPVLAFVIALMFLGGFGVLFEKLRK